MTLNEYQEDKDKQKLLFKIIDVLELKGYTGPIDVLYIAPEIRNEMSSEYAVVYKSCEDLYCSVFHIVVFDKQELKNSEVYFIEDVVFPGIEGINMAKKFADNFAINYIKNREKTCKIITSEEETDEEIEEGRIEILKQYLGEN